MSTINKRIYKREKKDKTCSRCSQVFSPASYRHNICVECKKDIDKIDYYREKMRLRKVNNQYNLNSKVIIDLENIEKRREEKRGVVL